MLNDAVDAPYVPPDPACVCPITTEVSITPPPFLSAFNMSLKPLIFSLPRLFFAPPSALRWFSPVARLSSSDGSVMVLLIGSLPHLQSLFTCRFEDEGWPARGDDNGVCGDGDNGDSSGMAPP